MDKSVGSAQECAGTGPPVGHPGTDGLGFLGVPPLLPSPALLAAQSRGSCRSAQFLRATRVVRKVLGGVGSRNSMVRAGRSNAEDL